MAYDNHYAYGTTFSSTEYTNSADYIKFWNHKRTFPNSSNAMQDIINLFVMLWIAVQKGTDSTFFDFQGWIFNIPQSATKQIKSVSAEAQNQSKFSTYASIKELNT